MSRAPIFQRWVIPFDADDFGITHSLIVKADPYRNNPFIDNLFKSPTNPLELTSALHGLRVPSLSIIVTSTKTIIYTTIFLLWFYSTCLLFLGYLSYHPLPLLHLLYTFSPHIFFLIQILISQ